MKRSFKLILQDFLQFSFFTLIFPFLISCGSDQETETDSTVEPDKGAIEVNEGDSRRFISKDRKKEEILADYEKPLVSYPAISSDESGAGADGLVYREGIEIPFTGRIIDRFESGEIKMDSSYLEGQPHGMQVRYFDNGKPALEASFDNGKLSGIKSRWWQNGLIREEEYWSEGKYRGRRLWDESGRLTKEEILP
jgi:hypothetical protein